MHLRFLKCFKYSRVSIRGQPDEDAVLCTQSKTYSIKFVETSNSVFLIPPLDESSVQFSQDHELKDSEQSAIAPVFKVSPGNLELTEVAPRLDKLKLLLSKNPYRSEEEMETEDLMERNQNRQNLYTWDDLVNEIQASDDELRSGLQSISAIEIDGCWRIVDDKYMEMVLAMILHNSVLNDWSLGRLNESEVVSVLESDGFPSKITRHCLRVYGTEVDDAAGRMWRLDERRLCVHFAKTILGEEDGKLHERMDKEDPRRNSSNY